MDQHNNYRLIIPNKDRLRIVTTVHERFAHVSIRKTLRLLADKYYWSNMDFDVRLIIGSCKECSERKSVLLKSHVQGNLNTGFPFEKICVDITGPLPTSNNGMRYI